MILLSAAKRVIFITYFKNSGISLSLFIGTMSPKLRKFLMKRIVFYNFFLLLMFSVFQSSCVISEPEDSDCGEEDYYEHSKLTDETAEKSLEEYFLNDPKDRYKTYLGIDDTAPLVKSGEKVVILNSRVAQLNENETYNPATNSDEIFILMLNQHIPSDQGRALKALNIETFQYLRVHSYYASGINLFNYRALMDLDFVHGILPLSAKDKISSTLWSNKLTKSEDGYVVGIATFPPYSLKVCKKIEKLGGIVKNRRDGLMLAIFQNVDTIAEIAEFPSLYHIFPRPSEPATDLYRLR